MKKKCISAFLIVVAGFVSALQYNLFVFPNDFAPAGLNGICTIIQHVFGFAFGYMSLIINIPLLILAFAFLDKDFAVKNCIYILAFSIFSILFKNIDGISSFALIANDGGEKIMAAMAAGLFNGVIYSTTIRLGGATGGMDIVASFINKVHPEFSFVWIIFAMNAFVSVLSFFAFGWQFIPVILCVLYSFVTSRVNDSILKGARSAAKFEVVTGSPEELSAKLMRELRHGCTVVPAKGMYSNTDKSLLICIVNRMQIADFEKIIKGFPDCFVIVSSVNNTYGNFKHIK